MTPLHAFIWPSFPAFVATVGNRASYRFLEFFTTQIRHPNTRRAYMRAVDEFVAR